LQDEYCDVASVKEESDTEITIEDNNIEFDNEDDHE
jgi:hypothetical protein